VYLALKLIRGGRFKKNFVLKKAVKKSILKFDFDDYTALKSNQRHWNILYAPLNVNLNSGLFQGTM
jgi:hypothetical protein